MGRRARNGRRPTSKRIECDGVEHRSVRWKSKRGNGKPFGCSKIEFLCRQGKTTMIPAIFGSDERGGETDGCARLQLREKAEKRGKSEQRRRSRVGIGRRNVFNQTDRRRLNTGKHRVRFSFAHRSIDRRFAFQKRLGRDGFGSFSTARVCGKRTKRCTKR